MNIPEHIDSIINSLTNAQSVSAIKGPLLGVREQVEALELELADLKSAHSILLNAHANITAQNSELKDKLAKPKRQPQKKSRGYEPLERDP